MAPAARVVKAFNTVFAEHMATGQVNGATLTLFVAGDDQGAKEQALTLGRDIGFDAVDAGPLKSARWLESLGYLNIQLGYGLKMGTHIGFKLVH
jgi:predicted dinucleotide-binding enzyme